MIGWIAKIYLADKRHMRTEQSKYAGNALNKSERYLMRFLSSVLTASTNFLKSSLNDLVL
jgi:hypothetical protein